MARSARALHWQILTALNVATAREAKADSAMARTTARHLVAEARGLRTEAAAQIAAVRARRQV